MGTQLPSPKGGRAPNFRPISIVAKRLDASRCQLVHGTELGLSPGDFVLDGDQAALPKRGDNPSIFGPCLLWPNGWMHQDATWYGGRPRPRRHCVRLAPSSSSPPQKKGDKRMDGSRWMAQTNGWIKMPLSSEVNLGPCDVVLDGVVAPS